ncbi:MAG: MFS transporter [Lachnospiraceae bacterium]|nr:MFS transporter [Lachnospiraceae bacterium]
MNSEQNSTTHMIFVRCCFGYAVSGMAVLVIGAILPSLMREASLSYALAGGALSMMAIGNMLASFFFPVLVQNLGTRLSITLTSFMVPICYFLLTLLPNIGLIYLIMLAAGIARGSITIINNMTVNVISHSSAKSLNLLHCSFAVGAFLAPFITALLIGNGLGWRSAMYMIVVLSFASACSYATMDYQATEQSAAGSQEASRTSSVEDRSFLKNFSFYCIGLLLFFYLGTENCINGWFVTYLQNTGVMSETFATTMVSVTWLTIMIGRLVCASLSKRYQKSTLTLINTIGGGVCFVILLFASQLPVITIALVGLGFFLAGIYPTCIADAGQYTKGSALGMSILTAISALGGIVTPQLIGSAADRVGILAAFGILALNAGVMIVFALVNFLKNHKSAKRQTTAA